MEIEGINFPDDAYYETFGSYTMVQMEDGKGRILITEFALKLMTDVVYIELPFEGDEITQGEAFGMMETVKATGETIAPISGKVIEINEDAIGDPNVLKEPGKNWLVVVEPTNLDEELKDLATGEKVKEYYTKEINKAKEEGTLK